MRRFLLVVPALLTLGPFTVSVPLTAQQGRQQGGITVPAYTDEQRWERLTFLSVSHITAGIASYKAQGKMGEDYGQFLGDLYAPGWGPANSGSAVRIARGVLFNSAAWRGSNAEVVSANDTAATIRFRRNHVRYFGAQRTLNGVSLDEYDRMFSVLNGRICAHLGVRCQDRADGEWHVVTLSGRGSAAVVGFPRGTYSVTLSPEDLPTNGAVAGTWEVAWMPNGRFAVRKDGQLQVEGDYELTLDQIVHRNETGPLACSGTGTYRWSVNPATNALTFGRLADDCDGRFRVMTRRAYTKR